MSRVVSPTARAISIVKVVHAEVHHALLAMVATAIVILLSASMLLTLQLGLDTLSIRSVADHWKDWSDVVNQGHSLGRVGVVERSLYNVVGE